MAAKLTIGNLARQTGVPAKTIRFYEEQGVLPSPARTDAGYRLYTRNDVRRLRLIRQVRLLGLTLAEAKLLADQALSSECSEFADQLLDCIMRQRVAIDQRIAELMALRGELGELEAHTRHSQARARPGQRVAECAYCPILDEEGGDTQVRHESAHKE